MYSLKKRNATQMQFLVNVTKYSTFPPTLTKQQVKTWLTYLPVRRSMFQEDWE